METSIQDKFSSGEKQSKAKNLFFLFGNFVFDSLFLFERERKSEREKKVTKKEKKIKENGNNKKQGKEYEKKKRNNNYRNIANWNFCY